MHQSACHQKDGDQDDIHQGPCRDAPEDRPRPLGRLHIGDSSQGPQHDAVRLSPNLAAGQRMAKLVHEHQQEEGEILQDVPGE